MRLAQTQVWPMLRYFETMAPSTAASISASSNTTNGELPRVRPLRRNGLAIDAAGFFSEELDIGAADIDLAQRLRQRLALLRGEDQRKVFAIGDNQLEPFAQNIGALLGRELGPGRKCT